MPGYFKQFNTLVNSKMDRVDIEVLVTQMVAEQLANVAKPKIGNRKKSTAFQGLEGMEQEKDGSEDGPDVTKNDSNDSNAKINVTSPISSYRGSRRDIATHRNSSILINQQRSSGNV